MTAGFVHRSAKARVWCPPRKECKRIDYRPCEPEPQAFQPGRHAETHLTLQAQRLQRDRIVGAADQTLPPSPTPTEALPVRARVVTLRDRQARAAPPGA